VIGAFVGAFLGAAALEWTANPELRGALRVGWGAFLGRLAAAAMKSTVAVMIGALALVAAALAAA
jgi:uncharacterized protein YqgC (DUF456 family)